MYIFLDIDGVMVPAKGWKQPELLEDGFPAFSAKAVSALKSVLVDDTIIMLTSSHKSLFTVMEWKSIFERRGIADATIQTLPSNVTGFSRKNEILSWFAGNPAPDNFLIIDDDTSLNDLPDWLKQKLVLTSPYIGLTEERLSDMDLMVR